MDTSALRTRIAEAHLAPEDEVLRDLMRDAPPDTIRAAAARRGAGLVRHIRDETRPGLMELFLAEYGLSTREGVALMCLAEALLRVPDVATIDELIEDKIAPSGWSAHLGRSSSPLVNASTWALMLTGRILSDDESVGSVLRGLVRRLGEPVIRTAVSRAMKEMGRQFVLGETIAEAIHRGSPKEAQGFTFSYDMLGEAAMTAADARAFEAAYADAIAAMAGHAQSRDIRDNPGISVKLSALHPRYDTAHRDRVMLELVPSLAKLARAAAVAGIGLNVDAEEAERLDLSLDVIEAVQVDPGLDGWEGFGVVVQAYGKRAAPVIDWVHDLAGRVGRRMMVRLVKGAYWDSEIKRAQLDGLPDFPVLTRKAATDVSYICNARRLLDRTDRIYPQFATHNAHTVAAILEMATDRTAFEFQRLHGMGESLHDAVHASEGTRCRIYAPVGAHRDLLAYLVRRLLENGANSSFVNQIVDASIAPEMVAADPFTVLAGLGPNVAVKDPGTLYAPERCNSRGWDLGTPAGLAAYEAARRPYLGEAWTAEPILAVPHSAKRAHEVISPSDPDDRVGNVRFATSADVEAAVAAAAPWTADPGTRAATLVRAADLYEEASGEFFAVLAREAGKTPRDCVSELREAVDFLRYYAVCGRRLSEPPRGRIVCISPWNFPLAIFTGPVAAALTAGNAVLAKPAESTSLTAAIATRLLHAAGVPRTALQLLPGLGANVGARLVSHPGIDGVLFTGSTATARSIERALAASAAPLVPFLAETGGINAMIVDSTALPEQAVRDILASAFQSAGQRCSALRVLCVQEDVAKPLLDMLFGAMDELTIGDPVAFDCDIGPVITAAAAKGIRAYVDTARREGRVLKELPAPSEGHFVGPTVVRVAGIADVKREVFGPVLHVATFRAGDLDRIVDAINASGYGLTFAMHSRIDGRIGQVLDRLRVGNAYVNRNQIGAIVESQPFGGEGLSGTGPKAGGPAYVPRLVKPRREIIPEAPGAPADAAAVQACLDKAAGQAPRCLGSTELPGPTGESNRLTEWGRGVVLCLGPGADRARQQARIAEENGCIAVIVSPGASGPLSVDGMFPPALLSELRNVDAVICEAGDEALRPLRAALAARDGPILPLLGEADIGVRCRIERSVSIDTTSAGGNAQLLAAAAG